MAQAEATRPTQQAEPADQVDDFVAVERLQELGINASDIKKAKEGGIHTCMALISGTKKALAAIKGLSEARIDKMQDAAKKMCPDCHSWMTAAQVEDRRRREIIYINFGAEAINEMLDGGLETRCLTEIYGEYRTLQESMEICCLAEVDGKGRCGKTQICHTICVTCQMSPEEGGAAGRVAYVDTEGTFRPKRIAEIAKRFQLDPDAVLNNIVAARALNHEHQMDLLTSIMAMMADEPFKVLIVDSIMANFRADFTGRGELAERQQKLNVMLRRLKQIAEEFNIAVLYTNPVMSDPGAGAMFVADPKKPLGGHVLAHASQVRLYARKGKGEQRVLKVVQSMTSAEREASFQITSQGIVDFKD